ncbi:MAG: tRNA (cytidine(34)-2'-O)-methyltransferase [Alphaproteobacteria bacterium]
MMHLVLYQPDIPQNTGTLLRMSACLGFHVHIVEPCGFLFTNRYLMRSGMDYLLHAQYTRHTNWLHFLEHVATKQQGRLLVLSSKAQTAYHHFQFKPHDYLILGRESAGLPEEIMQQADASLIIPMQAGVRSLNQAIAGAMVMGEALRQTNGFPQLNVGIE